MLIEAKLSHGFWSEAARFVIHVSNCSPHTPLKNKTPFKMWHNHKPVAYNLWSFGSIAYAHIDKSLQKKLDPKADKCRLMGYQPGTKAFQLWRIWDRKIIIQHDIILDENTSNYPPPTESTIPFYIEEELEKLDQTTNSTG